MTSCKSLFTEYKFRMETWKPIPGAEGEYAVSDQGRVKSICRVIDKLAPPGKPNFTRKTIPERVLRPGPSASGHLSVVLGRSRGSKGVHRLVLLAFAGPCPDGMEALHLNGNPRDNRLRNLRWGTRGENIKMDYDSGVRARTPVSIADRIRRLRAEGLPYWRIALLTGVSTPTAHRLGRQ